MGGRGSRANAMKMGIFDVIASWVNITSKEENVLLIVVLIMSQK